MAKLDPGPVLVPSSSLSKQSPFFLKFLVSFLLLGFAFRLYTSHSLDSSLAIGLFPSSEKDQIRSTCDLYKGRWVPNLSLPVYNNRTCRVIDEHQNCMKNGRRDTTYLKWRWRPRHCDLPFFNAERFLNMMRNKSWGFIGDSISRNQVQSFLCLLSQVEPAIQTYHDANFKCRKWRFESYNISVSVIWSPFLVRADVFEDENGVSTGEIKLQLDKVDEKWTSEYESFSHVIIAGGKWFLKSAVYYEDGIPKGCHYCSKKELTELGFGYAYRQALKRVFNYILSSRQKPTVIFRTITADHFENGAWDTGGTCPRKIPYKEGEVELNSLDRVLRDVEVEEYRKASVVAAKEGVDLRMLDITLLTLLRPDGHPGPYRHFHPFKQDKNARVQNDCLHWCVPGPIDSWNDLLMAILRMNK